MRTLFAFLIAFVAFFTMGALIEASSPLLSTAQIIVLAALMSAFAFLATILTPDFLAPNAALPGHSRGGGRDKYQTHRKPRAVKHRTLGRTGMTGRSGTMVSILWGVIRIEITPMQPVQVMA